MAIPLLVAVMAVSISGANLLLDDLIVLNPSLEKYEYTGIRGAELYGVLSNEPYPLSFLFTEEEGRVVLIQSKIFTFDAVEWYPWFDQSEDEPETLMVYGPVYTQQIFLANPAREIERIPLRHISYLGRGLVLQFEESVPLNFDALKAINPSLEHYEPSDPTVSDDERVVLYAPTGPGIAFLADTKGDIFALLFLFPEEAGWRDWADQEQGLPLEHPQLGGIYTRTIFLTEPEFDFDLDKWLAGMERERILGTVAYEPGVGGIVEPGFMYSDLEFERMPFGPLVSISGEMTNDTGKDYLAVAFRVKLFDEYGKQVGDGAFGFHGFKHGQTEAIEGMAQFDTEVDLDNLSFEIEIVFMY